MMSSNIYLRSNILYLKTDDTAHYLKLNSGSDGPDLVAGTKGCLSVGSTNILTWTTNQISINKPIYMSSANIYLESTNIIYLKTDDTAHYLKFHSSNDGPDLSAGTKGSLSYCSTNVLTWENGAVKIIGSCTATTFNVSSDYRIKSNIQSLKDVNFSVDSLRPVFYINTKTNNPDIGLIAHEVQEQLPFIVSGTKDGKDIQSVNYTSIISLLIHEIQELKTRVKILEQNRM
jgi:hypothetical protein